MQNVGIVRGGEGIRDAGQQVYDLMRLALLPGRPVAEGTCFDEFGDQVLAAFKLPRIVDRNDVRMVQRQAIWASRWNRRRPAASATAPERNLIATLRPSRVSRARYTWLMPPAPTRVSI